MSGASFPAGLSEKAFLWGFVGWYRGYVDECVRGGEEMERWTVNRRMEMAVERKGVEMEWNGTGGGKRSESPC